MIDWWSETEQDVIESLAAAGPMSPQDLAQRLHLSEGEVIAFLCMLAREKKVSIQLVGLSGAPASRPARGNGRARDKAATRFEPVYAGGH
jgi:predicted ArsR family transcriptional regulator